MVFSIILDAVLILFLIFKLIMGVKKGMIRSLLSFFGTVIILIISNLLSNYLSNVMYDNIISKSITNNIVSQVNSGNREVVFSLQNAINSLPKFLQNLLATSDVSANSINTAMNADAIAQAVNNAVRPLIVGVLQVIIFIALFFHWYNKLFQ